MIEREKLYLDAVIEISKVLRLQPELVRAIIQVESEGDVYATRFEPDWKYFYIPSEMAKRTHVTLLTERNGQATSWGLMQVMGAVAREFGFKGKFPQLCEPKEGISYGCLKLRQLFDLYKDERSVIAAYNAGSPRTDGRGFFVNQPYVDKVMVYKRQIMNNQGV